MGIDGSEIKRRKENIKPKPQPYLRRYAKSLLAVSLLIITVAIVLIISISLSKSDYSAAINTVILADTTLGNFDEATKTVEVEYKQKQNRKKLYDFWSNYIVACKSGSCAKVHILPEFKGDSESAAYEVAKDIVKDFLKSPVSARFEEKGNLSKEKKIGSFFYFSFYVDSENPFKAVLRTHIDITLRNVGESSWHVVNLSYK